MSKHRAVLAAGLLATAAVTALAGAAPIMADSVLGAPKPPPATEVGERILNHKTGKCLGGDGKTYGCTDESRNIRWELTGDGQLKNLKTKRCLGGDGNASHDCADKSRKELKWTYELGMTFENAVADKCLNDDGKTYSCNDSAKNLKWTRIIT